jgi:hypothetical protein
MTNIQSPQKLLGYTKEINQLFFRKLMLLNPLSMLYGRGNNEMSQMQEYEYKLRRAHWEGKGGIACCLNIPKPFWQRMEIGKQSYLKVTYLNDGNKLVVEKIQ